MSRRFSARDLGRMVGKDAKEVNKDLFNLGYLSGGPGNWFITEEGKKHGEMRDHDNGYGGWAARAWSFAVWDRDVAKQIGDPDKYIKEINEKRKAWGGPLLDFGDDD